MWTFLGEGPLFYESQCARTSLGHIPKNEFAGSYSVRAFSILQENDKIVFQNACIDVYFHQQYIEILYPCQYFV